MGAIGVVHCESQTVAKGVVHVSLQAVADLVQGGTPQGRSKVQTPPACLPGQQNA